MISDSTLPSNNHHKLTFSIHVRLLSDFREDGKCEPKLENGFWKWNHSWAKVWKWNCRRVFDQQSKRNVRTTNNTIRHHSRSNIYKCKIWHLPFLKFGGGGFFFQCAQKKALPIRVPALFFGGFSWEWKRKKEGDWVRLRLAPLLSGNTVVPLHEHGLLIIVVLEFLIDAVLRQWNLSPCIFLRNRCSH